MFQNVREKNSLAYTAQSNYVRQKNLIFIRCGIEIENYEKAVNIIKEQLEDMKNGNITEEEVDNAKKYIVSSIKMLTEEQFSIVTYYMANELSDSSLSTEDYIKDIEAVTKESIINIAKDIELDTIYFLKN